MKFIKNKVLVSSSIYLSPPQEIEVFDIIISLKPKKSCGPDDIGNMGLKVTTMLSQSYMQHNQGRKLFTDVITSGYSTFDKARWLAILFSAAELREKASLNLLYCKDELSEVALAYLGGGG